MCPGTWSWHSDHSDFSGRRAPVPCGVFADLLRLCLSAQVRKEVSMKIVVVKSPKALRGLLQKLFSLA